MAWKGTRKIGSNRWRLDRIADIIEDVDLRCMATDGPVTKTRNEITDDEIREIYKLASERE